MPDTAKFLYIISPLILIRAEVNIVIHIFKDTPDQGRTQDVPGAQSSFIVPKCLPGLLMSTGRIPVMFPKDNNSV